VSSDGLLLLWKSLDIYTLDIECDTLEAITTFLTIVRKVDFLE
jgi:hypothetical protein